MDSDINELQCPVCYEIFNGTVNLPRLLSCGHCFCSNCLGQILPLRSFCPSCKGPISTCNVKSLPINYPLKNLAEKFQQKNCLGKTKQYASLGNCITHNNPQQLYCHNHKEFFLCGMCSTLHHKDCNISVIEEVLSDIQVDYLNAIQTEVDSIKLQDSKIENERSITKFLIANKKEEVRSKELLYSLQGDERSKLAKILSDTIKLKDDMEAARNMTPSILKKFHSRFTAIKKGRTLGMKNTIPISITSNQSPRQIWNHSQNMYVYIERDSKKLYGPVIRDKKLLRVGCFQESEKTFENSMKFNEFLYILTGSLDLPLKAFFQVELDNCRYLNPIVISTENNTARARNFLNLSLGLGGVSYCGTKFYRVKNKGQPAERVYGGDYQFNNGSGSPAVVDGICGGDIQRVRYRRGHVKGVQPMFRDSLSRFGIVLRDAVENDGWPSVFGIVEEGLDTMDTIAKRGGKRGHIKSASIYNCGILVSHPTFG